MEIDFSEMVSGTTRKINLRKSTVCDACAGSGGEKNSQEKIKPDKEVEKAKAEPKPAIKKEEFLEAPDPANLLPAADNKSEAPKEAKDTQDTDVQPNSDGGESDRDKKNQGDIHRF